MRNIGLWIVIVFVVVAGVAVLMWRQGQVTDEDRVVIPEEPSPTLVVEGGAGGQFVQQEPSLTVPPSATQEALTQTEETTVSISDAGFSPAQVTVAAGTKVTFVNNGQGLHWPASDPHPTHTNLKGLDARKGLATGDTYSFIFSTPGTWGYHDHLNPKLKGTVVVD